MRPAAAGGRLPAQSAAPWSAFALFLAAQTLLLLALVLVDPKFLWMAGGAAALAALLCAPIPVVVTVFVLVSVLFPYTEYRFRIALGAMSALFFLILIGDRLRLVLDGRISTPRMPIFGPIAIFLGAVVFSSVVGIAAGASIIEWPLEAFPYACLALVPIVARRLTVKSLSRVFFVYCVVVSIQSVRAIGEFASGGFIRLQTASFSVHPGLAAVVLLSLSVMHEERRWRRWASAALFVTFLQLVSTMTRGYWLGFLGAAFVVYYAAWRTVPARTFRRLLIGSFAVIGFVAIALYLLLVRWGLLEVLQVLGKRAETLSALGADASTRVRMAEWRAAWKYFLESPIIGKGYGFHLGFLDPIFLKRGTLNWWVHNSYLLLLLKMGIIGLVAFLGVIVAYLREAVRIIRSTRGASRAFVVGFIGNVVQLLVMAATNYTFDSPVNMPYVALILGATIAIGREAANHDSSTESVA